LHYINVDIEKCFDWISHSAILKYTPICEKYYFFIQAWLYAPIYGTKVARCQNFVKVVPRRGVFQGSGIGPLICNIVLDGLENYLLNPLSYQYFFNSEEIKCIHKKFGNTKMQQYSYLNKYSRVKIKIYRYIDDLLIIGKGSYEQFLTISKRLIVFLAERGLFIKNSENPVQVFCPGAKFEYLGFQFQLANRKDPKINKGKYIRYSYLQPFILLRSFCSVEFRSGLLIIIRNKLYKAIKLTFCYLFMRNRAVFSVEKVIKKYNQWLSGVVNYFGLN